MNLQERLKSLEPSETWSSLHAAAMERYWDGVELATGPESRRTAAIYLLGYVAEILLKVAIYRAMEVGEGEQVRRQEIKNRASWHGKNFHNLGGLADVLIAERAAKKRALDSVLAGELKVHVMRVASHWSETLRYRHTTANETELVEVYQGVDWLFANATLLWS